ncbi:MAG: minichromosome maintenance protein MCM, partial [bacterium]|nr:minichromosome maintenance protein MCM [bacterium]
GLPQLTPLNSGTFEPHIRFYNIPDVSSTLALKLGKEHLNRLASVEGVINLVTEVKPRLKVGTFQCEHCHLEHRLEQERFRQRKPFACQCGRRDFKLLEAQSLFSDVQRAQLQDPLEKTKGNVTNNFIELWLEDDLVTKVNPGERVIAVGILRTREAKEKNGPGKSSIYEKFFQVLHLQKSEKDFEELEVTKEEAEQIKILSKDPALLDKIVKSVAPSIYGYPKMKEAIVLQLFGGTPNKVLPDGKHIRADLHIILIGDPGTAKSTLMRYVGELAPKSIFVSGESSSSAGLTAAAEKDELGGWTLKAGALVLASGGIVLIDEFDKMNKEDMGSMHTALEQQTLNVAKAGIVAEFKTKTSVLAAANPKLGRFDPNQPVFSQFDIKPPLLSRFDLIFTIKDILDENNDRKMADHILMAHKYSDAASQGNFT